MGTISIKRFVAEDFAKYIELNIFELLNKTSTVPAGPETNAPCLKLLVLPEQFSFEASEALEVYENSMIGGGDDGIVVFDVGEFTGRFTLQLYTTSPSERETIEQKLLDFFLYSPWTPGTVFRTTLPCTVNGYDMGLGFDYKVYLDTEEWNDELAFENKRFSFLTCTVEFPALTSQPAVNLTSLQVCLSTTDKEIVTVADIDYRDRVEVLQDGTVIRGTA